MGETQKVREDFERSIVRHLKRTCGRDYTLDQATRKVKKLWENLGDDDSKTVNDVYQLGTTSLHYLSDDHRDEIRRRAKSLMPDTYRHVLRGRRQGRSSSRATRDNFSRPRNTESSGRASCHPTKRRVEVVVSPPNPHPSHKRIKREHTVKPFQDGRLSLPDHIRDSDDSPSDTDVSIPSSSSKFGSMRSGRRSTPNKRPTKSDKIITNSTAVPIARGRPESRRELTRSEQQDYHAPLDPSEDEYFKTKKALEDLRSNYRALQYVSNTDQESVATELMRKTDTIIRLREQLEAARAADKTTTNQYKLNSADIYMGRIELAIDLILTDKQLSVHFNTKRVLPSDSENLVRRVVGSDDSADFSQVLSQVLSYSFDERDFVRALVAAALCEWVFEPSLPGMDLEPCALAKKYREHIFRRSGSAELERLDFAAHRSRVDYYKDVAMRIEAKKLVNRLSEALHCLSSTAPYRQKQKEENEKLDNIFKRALELKADATVSKGCFKVVQYATGTPFKARFMKVEQDSNMTPEEPAFVNLCILPSLQVSNCENSLVSTNNFAPCSKCRGKPKAIIVLTKAVVLLSR